jgi:hypothetical protein
MPASSNLLLVRLCLPFVSCRGTTVDEVLYPLAVGKQLSHYEDVVNDLMSMDPEGANVRVSNTRHVVGSWFGQPCPAVRRWRLGIYISCQGILRPKPLLAVG